MRKLAFLIDEIDNSKELIRFAALLGKDINARVHVLYFQTTLYSYGGDGLTGTEIPPDPELYQKISDDIKEKVDGFIKEIEAEHTGISPIEFRSEIGDASLTLKEKVENKTYDILMLQGHSEQDFWLQDSVNMNVVRNVPCPVYIIPPDARYQPMRKIIYATDYNEEDIATLKNLIELTKPFDPEIVALHISNDDEFEKQLMSEGFAALLSEKTGYNKVSVKIISDDGGKDAVESLVNEAEKAKANLIVVLKENRNFFERLFKSSFTTQLVKEAQLPILVFDKQSGN
jgi:nucleotide-binding universal stress UspA family protein